MKTRNLQRAQICGKQGLICVSAYGNSQLNTHYYLVVRYTSAYVNQPTVLQKVALEGCRGAKQLSSLNLQRPSSVHFGYKGWLKKPRE